MDCGRKKISRFLTIAALSTCFVAFLGCFHESADESDAPEETTRPRVEDVEKGDGEPPKNVEEEKESAISGEAARVLGNAASDFVGVFSDDEESEKIDDKSGSGSIDWELVDPETKEKYLVDRSLVAPSLARTEPLSSDAPRYKLEYKFPLRSNIEWSVVHLVRKRVSYGGKEKLIETSSTTRRRWEVHGQDANGRALVRHWIDRMILRQDDHEKEPISYDSEKDVVVPPEISAFGTEKAVGVALETFAIDACGVMFDKKKLIAEYNGREGDSNVMVPFPDEEVAVGDVWTTPYALYLKGSDDVSRPYRVVERFRLDSVDEKYAAISFETTLLSIVDDPVVEGALAERLFTGRALFDRELGQTTRTELNFKKTAPGAFGFASFLEYNCQVVEKLEDVVGIDESTDVSQ